MKYFVTIIFEFSNTTNKLPYIKNKDMARIDKTFKDY